MNKKTKIEGLENFLTLNNIIFKDIKYYIQALTHKTYANEHANIESYDILEFIGDAILQMKSSIFIFQHFQNITEGEASLIRAKNVCSSGLSELSKKLGLSKLLLISKGSEHLRENVKINADLFESFVAAIYLDLGDEKLEEFLKEIFYPYISTTNLESIKDPKSSFQEYIQSYSNEIIEYKITQLENELRSELFKAELMHNGITYGVGFGKTKKVAEEEAATRALETLKAPSKQTIKKAIKAEKKE
ncbi:ribonuclease III [[Mycoplasma] mobile]|uniref:Ribonuclease 3 n=1 Tax=Mycoplasma mobile (strain ATCC 43663 / 163K / NCTC 11711) TaxID=267748 RepID=RNC_MYCM1|nr:ribonuclease III [[Mycoplasma] mobile]Q6KHN3.1 RecName: Full=Ribonuclease 3; AltName: Full=Ribonuclease III; Short=RNase III [Mycoplasma mobile 163K]AAT27897.1 ribonuclease III [Mycoplasma mobile 163K]